MGRYSIAKLPFAEIYNKPEDGIYRRVGHHYGRPRQCNEFYLNYNECLEAYGRARGFAPCEPFRIDWMECKKGDYALARMGRIRAERIRQILEGERKMSDYWGYKPPRDSFIRRE